MTTGMRRHEKLRRLISVFSAIVPILSVGLVKSQLFKISASVGAIQNLAYLLALLPLYSTFLMSLDVETTTIVISAISAAVLPTPGF